MEEQRTKDQLRSIMQLDGEVFVIGGGIWKTPTLHANNLASQGLANSIGG